jgi:HPt (histidine-containing phosphotransfer) domain-containing protein
LNCDLVIAPVLEADAPPPAAANKASIDTGNSVDWAAALSSVGGDRELLQSVVAAALEEWPVLVGQLQDAVQRHDDVTVRRVIHTLKNAFRTLGADKASALAERLETAERNHALSATSFAALFEIIDEVSGELSAYLGDPQRV